MPAIRLRQAFSLGGLTVRELAIRTWKKVEDHEIMTRASAVSFYAMLALVPFLALILTIAVQFLPDIRSRSGQRIGVGNLTTEELDSTFKTAFPDQAYQVVHSQIERLQNQARPSFLLLILGLVFTIWPATSLFAAIIDALNRIWGVSETRSILKVRLTAAVLTCIQALILIGSLLLIVLWPQILSFLGVSRPAAIVATAVQWVTIFVMLVLSFELVFYFGPDAEQHWEWITPGSLLGTIVVLAANFGFRVYVQHFSTYNATYGSLGGVMVLLFWFWICSLVLLTSAQMNQIIEEASPMGKAYGQRVDPTDAPDFNALVPEPSSR
jgi:membrane protein